MGAATPRTGFDWDRVTAISALLVSFVAVGVAAYTAQLQRQQVRAQVWPRAQFYNAGALGEFHVANKGMGPLIVRSARVTLDGKPLKNWGQLATALGLPPERMGYSSLNGAVLSSGEDMTYLQPGTKEQFTALRAVAGERWNATICYCSALEECWTTQSHPRGTEDVTREVDACPRFDPALEFEN